MVESVDHYFTKESVDVGEQTDGHIVLYICLSPLLCRSIKFASFHCRGTFPFFRHAENN